MQFRHYCILTCAFFPAAAIAFSGRTVQAEIRAGTINIEPRISWQELYDNNIYLDAVDRKSSLITVISPGINLSMPLSSHKLELRYNSDILSYSENPEHNNTVNSAVNVLGRFTFPAGLFVTVQDYFLNTTDPLNTEIIQRVRRNQNLFSVRAGYQFSRFLTFGCGFSQVLQDYIPEEYRLLLNRRESEATAELAYSYSSKTSALLEYAHGTVDYSYASNTNSSRYDRLAVGLRGELTPKTLGEVRFGGTSRTYDEISGRNVTTPTLSLSTITEFTKRTKLTLTANRNFVESIYFDNLYFISNSLDGLLSQRLYRDWTVTLEGLFALNVYPEDIPVDVGTRKRRDSYALASLHVIYNALGWLSVDANYTSRQRNSNFEMFYYLDTVIGLSATVTY